MTGFRRYVEVRPVEDYCFSVHSRRDHAIAATRPLSVFFRISSLNSSKVYCLFPSSDGIMVLLVSLLYVRALMTESIFLIADSLSRVGTLRFKKGGFFLGLPDIKFYFRLPE